MSTLSKSDFVTLSQYSMQLAIFLVSILGSIFVGGTVGGYLTSNQNFNGGTGEAVRIESISPADPPPSNIREVEFKPESVVKRATNPQPKVQKRTPSEPSVTHIQPVRLTVPSFKIRNFEGGEVTVPASQVVIMTWTDGKDYHILKADLEKYRNRALENKKKELEFLALKAYLKNMEDQIRERTRQMMEDRKPIVNNYIPNYSSDVNRQLEKIMNDFNSSIQSVPSLTRPDGNVEYHCYTSNEEYWTYHPENRPAPIPNAGLQGVSLPCEYFQNGKLLR